MIKRIILVLILAAPSYSFAGRYWTEWEEIRGKGVVGCSESDAKAKARGRCNARLPSGHKVERVQLSGFNREIWRDGFMNQERNCAYATNARCLITTPDSGFRKGTVDHKNETLIINNCTFPIFVSSGKITLKSWSTNAGVYVQDVYKVSQGHWRVNPRSKKVVRGAYLLIRSKGKTASRLQEGFCFHRSKFKYNIYVDESSGGRKGCAQKGGQWFLFEDMRKYKSYNINFCN